MLFAFARSAAPELLAGEPKIIHETRFERSETPAGATPHLSQEAEYERGNRPAEIRSYRADGKLSHRQIYLYDESGQLSRIDDIDADGVLYRTQKIHFATDQIEVRETLDRQGNLIERTTTRRDAAGRVLESSLVEITGTSETTRLELSAEYDSETEPIKYKVRQHQSDGVVLLLEQQRNRELEAFLTATDGAPFTPLSLPGNGAITTETRTIERDIQGNWIRQETYVLGVLNTESFREITYY